jgi:prepilin-type N-terminal cleavage/methylation domain-containing protein
MRSAKKGFTLIELLIVVVIVGILALAAIPLITANTRDARRSEGEQMLGSVKNQGKVAYAKLGTNKPSSIVGQLGTTPPTGWNVELTQLTGKYYVVNPTATLNLPAVTITATPTGTSGNANDGTAQGVFNFDNPGADAITFS